MGTLFELHSTKQVSIVWNRLLEEGNELRPATTVFPLTGTCPMAMEKIQRCQH